MDDYGETATATGQPPASQSWAEQMDQADEARAAAADAIVTADAPPPTAEQEKDTPATTAAPESVDSPAHSPCDWTVQEGRKQRPSASPRKNDKVKATVTTNATHQVQTTNPVSGWQLLACATDVHNPGN